MHPLAGVEIRIGEAGEILIKAPGVFDGYAGAYPAAARALADGWLHTGDAGYLEDGGQLAVLGRTCAPAYTRCVTSCRSAGNKAD